MSYKFFFFFFFFSPSLSLSVRKGGRITETPRPIEITDNRDPVNQGPAVIHAYIYIVNINLCLIYVEICVLVWKLFIGNVITGERVNSVSRSVPASSNSCAKGGASIHAGWRTIWKKKKLDEVRFNYINRRTRRNNWIILLITTFLYQYPIIIIARNFWKRFPNSIVNSIVGDL